MSSQSSPPSDDNRCEDFLGLLPADLVPRDDAARLPCLAELLRGNINLSSSLKENTNIKELDHLNN
jgi:hypothetical protein